MLIQFSPEWFFGYDIILELFFAVITLTIFGVSYNIYKLSNERRTGLFALSFFFISISYIIQSSFNFLILIKLNETISMALKILSIESFNNIGFVLSIFMRVFGFIILTFMTIKTKNNKVLLLFIITTLVGLYTSQNILYTYSLISSIYLIFILSYYIKNYNKNKNNKTLFVAVAFFFILIGNAHYLFVVNHEIAYVLEHLLELIAYLFILTNLFLVKKS